MNEIFWGVMLLTNFLLVILAYKIFGKKGLLIWIPIATIVANIQVIQTILWSNIPGDFRVMNREKLFKLAMKDTRPGSILVLHDGNVLRPAPTLDLTERLLEAFSHKGWRCDSLRLD